MTVLIDQNFEGTGYDNSETWTESPGASTINPDYTTTILLGAQSLLMDGHTYSFPSIVSPTFTASDNAYLHLMFRVIRNAGDHIDEFIALRSSTTVVCRISFRYNDRKFYLQSGGQTGYGDVAAWELDTTYHIWMDYQKGTGANSAAQLYVGTTTTKPGVAYTTVTSGNATQQIDNLKIFPSDASVIFDQIKIADTEFTTVDGGATPIACPTIGDDFNI
jgi:hypothetical protein